MDSVAGWMEWKERCALGLCSPGVQVDLREFAAVRFEGFMTRYAARSGRGTTSPADAWHLFETHLAVGAGRQGKRYKDWLFARVGMTPDEPARVIQSGATLLMRDVVREYLRREFSPPAMTSLSAPLTRNEGPALTLEDILPGALDPSCDAEQRELEALSQQLAEKHFQDSARRERVVVLAKDAGLSLAHPEVEKAAGCGKSALADSYRAFVERIACAIRSEFGGDDPETVRHLVLLTLDDVKKRIREWISSEKSLARFFILVEDQ